jgi:hypothetical protein
MPTIEEEIQMVWMKVFFHAFNWNKKIVLRFVLEIEFKNLFLCDLIWVLRL